MVTASCGRFPAAGSSRAFEGGIDRSQSEHFPLAEAAAAVAVRRRSRIVEIRRICESRGGGCGGARLRNFN